MVSPSRVVSAARTVRQVQTASAPASSRADSISIRMKKLSSTTRMRAALSAAGPSSFTVCSTVRGLRQRHIIGAVQAAGLKLAADDRVRYAVLDQRPSDPGGLRRLDGLPPALSP